MILAPDIAKEKLCPFGQIMALVPFFTPEKTREFPQEIVCVADECMAWRWYIEPNTYTHIPDGNGYCGFGVWKEESSGIKN